MRLRETPSAAGLASPLAAQVLQVLQQVARAPHLPPGLRGEAVGLIPRVQLAAGCVQRLVFAPSQEPDVWTVGDEAAPRRLPGRGLGLRAAWQALSGQAPACADLVSPGAKCPEDTVRKAIRESAIPWAERSGCPQLATAFRRIHVRAGRLHYVPASGDPEPVCFWSAQVHGGDGACKDQASNLRGEP